MQEYNKISLKLSKVATNYYSTSFSLGVCMLRKQYRWAIYAIYGFVRFADEIVDTFHNHDKKALLQRFREDTYYAIHQKISSNPVLHSFQLAINEFGIEKELIDAFLKSMEMDLDKKEFSQNEFQDYVYGSAEVIGLMCMRVFYKNDKKTYEHLKPYACKLGEVFQKINFLRDLKSDYEIRGRVYFPALDYKAFDNYIKKNLEKEIQKDFNEAFVGVKLLKPEVRLGVYVAFKYYEHLLKKIKNKNAKDLLCGRIRVGNGKKILLLICCYFRNLINYL